MTVSLLSLCGGCNQPQAFVVSPPFTKKVLAFAEFSEPSWLLSQKTAIDASPIDGLFFDIPFTKPGTGSTYFRLQNFLNYTIPWSLIEPQVTIYNTIGFDHAYHNFPATNCRVGSGGMDWFNDTWTHSIIENFGSIARFAFQANLPGFMFDAETYDGAVWNPLLLPSYPTHSLAEHYAKVEEIGTLVGLKLAAYYPEIKVFLTTPNLGFLGDATVILYSYFLNGLVNGMSAAPPNFTGNLLSGEENTYQALTTADYDYYDNALYTALIGNTLLSPNYLPQQSKAFSVSPQGGGEDWSHIDFNLNYQTPSVFEAMATYALQLSGEYAWVFTRAVYWYPVVGSSNLIDEPYRAALRAARTANDMPVW